ILQNQLAAVLLYESFDNRTGIWLDSLSWVNNKSPGTSIVDEDVTCYGHLTSYNCLSKNKGTLFVYDTLIINGDLSLGNLASLFIDTGAVLIIYGNYTSGNKIEVNNYGTFVVAGEFEMLGADNQGFFKNEGEVFIFDTLPQIKQGVLYEDLACDSPHSCGYRNYDSLMVHDFKNTYFSYPFSNIPRNQSLECTKAYYIASDSNLCLNDEITLHNLSRGWGPGDVVTWDFGDGAQVLHVDENTSVLKYATPGVKSVQLTIIKGVDILTFTKDIMVYDLPSALLYDSVVCGTQLATVRGTLLNANVFEFSLDLGNSIAHMDDSYPYTSTFNVTPGDSLVIWGRAVNNVAGCKSDWETNAKLKRIAIPGIHITSNDSFCGAGNAIYNATTINGHLIEFSSDKNNVLESFDSTHAQFNYFLNETEIIEMFARAVDTIGNCVSEWAKSKKIKALKIPTYGFPQDSVIFTMENSSITVATPDKNIVQFSIDGINVEIIDVTSPFKQTIYLENNQPKSIWIKVINSNTGCESKWKKETTIYPLALPSLTWYHSPHTPMSLTEAYMVNINRQRFVLHGLCSEKNEYSNRLLFNH
ncbi:MAG: hypothetical protein MI922_27950, partial [Bacteroidales bacterium]|nr:hypothetical protein [Bacteroidales bacterium]